MASAFTQTQLDALTNAISQGVTRIEYDGKTVQYASIADMLALRDRMTRELGHGTSRKPPLARRSVFRSN